jgi:hypothetical protein
MDVHIYVTPKTVRATRFGTKRHNLSPLIPAYMRGHINCIAANYILVILDHSLVFRVTIPDVASIQFNLLMMGI